MAAATYFRIALRARQASPDNFTPAAVEAAASQRFELR
jgi:hypothetical protein